MVTEDSLNITETESFDLDKFMALAIEGSDLNAVDHENTLLIQAARTNQSSIFDFVLACGCDPNICNLYGESPLSICAQYGNEKNVLLLLDFSADPNLQDKSGRTALMHAIMNRHLPVVQILIDGGSDLDLEDDFGMTALMYSLKYLSMDDLKELFQPETLEKLKKQIEVYPEKIVSIKEKLKQKTESEGGSQQVGLEGEDETSTKRGITIQQQTDNAASKKESSSDRKGYRDELTTGSMKVKSVEDDKDKSTENLLGGKTQGTDRENDREIVKSQSQDQKDQAWNTKSQGFKDKDLGGVSVTNREGQEKEEIDDIQKIKSLGEKNGNKTDPSRAKSIPNKKKGDEPKHEAPEEMDNQQEEAGDFGDDEFINLREELNSQLDKLGSFIEKRVDINLIASDKMTTAKLKEVVKEKVSFFDRAQSSQIVKESGKSSDDNGKILIKEEQGVVQRTDIEKLNIEQEKDQIKKEKAIKGPNINKEEATKVAPSSNQVIEKAEANKIISGKNTTIEKMVVANKDKTSPSIEKSVKQEEEKVQKQNTELKIEAAKSDLKVSSGASSSSSKTTGKTDEKIIEDVTLKLGDKEKKVVEKGQTETEEEVVKVQQKDTVGDLFANEKKVIKEAGSIKKDESQNIETKRPEVKKDVELEIIQSNEKKIEESTLSDVNVDIDGVQLIPKEKANEKNKKGQTHLMIAAGKGDLDRVDLLLKSGAETSLKDFNGFNALMYAAQAGQLEAVQILAKKTSELDVKTSKGYTALSLAVLKNQGKCISALVKAGAKMDIDIQGEDLLSLAVSKDAMDSIKVLVLLGMNPFNKNKKGRSAVDLAKKMKKKSIVNFFNKQLTKLVK